MASRETGDNPRALGTSPRQIGINPRALRKNPRAQLTLVENDDQSLPTPSTRDLVEALVDHCRANGLPLYRRTIGMLAKATKELLEDGFAEDLVAEGLVVAVTTNEPARLGPICQGLALSRSGLLMDRRTATKRMQDEAEIAAARHRFAR